jgi:hypothetical protein
MDDTDVNDELLRLGDTGLNELFKRVDIAKYVRSLYNKSVRINVISEEEFFMLFPFSQEFYNKITHCAYNLSIKEISAINEFELRLNKKLIG